MHAAKGPRLRDPTRQTAARKKESGPRPDDRGSPERTASADGPYKAQAVALNSLVAILPRFLHCEPQKARLSGRNDNMGSRQRKTKGWYESQRYTCLGRPPLQRSNPGSGPPPDRVGI
jgi:hypothetical protein